MGNIKKLMMDKKKSLSCTLRNLADEIEDAGLNVIWTASDKDIEIAIHRAVENRINIKKGI